MRIVQVGCLGMGKRWVQVGLDAAEVDVAGYVDVRPEHLERIQSDFGIAPERCFLDLGAALEACRPDTVLIVTPPQFHYEVAAQALRFGCHVLSEKPLADTWERCLAAVAVARETGRTMAVSQNYRYRPVIQALRQTLQSGAYGRPAQVSLEFFRGPHFGGFREEMPYPLIIDMSIHHYDLLRYVLGADPVSIFARSWNPPWSWYQGDASSTSIIEMRTPDQQPVHVTYAASWCARGINTAWNGHWTVFCDDGIVALRDDKLYGQRTGEKELVELPVPAMARTDQAHVLEAFRRAVAAGVEPETSAQDNLRSIEMVFKTVASCERGETVVCGEV